MTLYWRTGNTSGVIGTYTAKGVCKDFWLLVRHTSSRGWHPGTQSGSQLFLFRFFYLVYFLFKRLHSSFGKDLAVSRYFFLRQNFNKKKIYIDTKPLKLSAWPTGDARGQNFLFFFKFEVGFLQL